MNTPNSSISSSDRQWRSFARTLLVSFFALVISGYVFILFIDPYDNLPVSPNMDRYPVDQLQRLFHPALARKSEFSSAIIGNSNIRLLRPEQLDGLFDSRFVNLGMDAASPWEQEQIFNVFANNHQSIEVVIFGLDYLWCYQDYQEDRFVGFSTEAGFPFRFFDDNGMNNFPAYNLLTLQHAWKQLLVTTGIQASEYGRDGYTEFTDPMEEYDLNRARFNIYGSVDPKPVELVRPPETLSDDELDALRSSAWERLDRMLGKLPEESSKILVFVPYHIYFQAVPGSREQLIWEDCKRITVDLARQYDNAHVLDFMIESPITTQDANYWDFKHYTVPVAGQIGDHIADAVINGRNDDPNFRVLYTAQ